jgi:anti-sigma factor RsiW
MTCHEAAAYVGPYVDGELTVSDTLAFDAHVATCRLCARLVDQQRAWIRVAQQAPRYRAPEGLEARIRAALPAGTDVASNVAPVQPLPSAQAVPSAQALPFVSRRSDVEALAPAAAPSAAAMRASTRGSRWMPWLAAAAALIVGAALAATFWLWMTRTGATTEDLVAHDIVSSHVRSLMAQHLTDVPSSDHHTVKPWFAGKVPYTLGVPDLAAHDFTLDGGRLDYIGGRTVAALVYRRRQHVINLFVWPLAPGDRPATVARSSLGYELTAWTAQGQQYWAVSDLNDAELREFVSLIQ